MPPETLTQFSVKRSGFRWEILDAEGELIGNADGLSSALEVIEDGLAWGQKIVATKRRKFSDNSVGFLVEVG